MKVDLTLLHAGVNNSHFCCSARKNTYKKNKIKMPLCSRCCKLMVYEVMLVKANIPNDKESSNSKKDGVK